MKSKVGPYLLLLLCSGSDFRFVCANSSNCFSLIESTIEREAPFNFDFGVSPLFADRAAPAACC